jgi:hypothetical protein
MGRQLNFAHDAGPLFDRLPRLPPAPAPAPPPRGKGRKAAGKVPARRPEPVAVNRSDPKVARAAKASAKAIRDEDRAGLKAAKAQRIAEYDAQLMRLAELTKQLRSWVRRVKAAGAMEHLHTAPRIHPHAAAAFADLLHYD